MNTLQSPPDFLQAILEGFVDGILVLTEQKTLLYANLTACRLCHHLTQTRLETVPPAVWHVCEALIESRTLYPDHSFVIESEVECNATTLSIRVQWLLFEGLADPCLLVKLQDQTQIAETLAIAEAQTWNLSDRETQVWLLRRAGLNRKQIAQQLYITLDTVKKHIRNIQFKRRTYQDETAWRLSRAS